jgi:Domain of unknown function (DUF1508)
MAGKFEIFKDARGEYRFHLTAANGEIIASSEGYKSRLPRGVRGRTASGYVGMHTPATSRPPGCCVAVHRRPGWAWRAGILDRFLLGPPRHQEVLHGSPGIFRWRARLAGGDHLGVIGLAGQPIFPPRWRWNECCTEQSASSCLHCRCGHPDCSRESSGKALSRAPTLDNRDCASRCLR